MPVRVVTAAKISNHRVICRIRLGFLYGIHWDLFNPSAETESAIRIF